MSGRPAAHTRLVPLEIEGPAGKLEALLQEHEARDHAIAALVCHPHPLYGGTLHNKVVHRAASTLHALGAAVLRFNFRGAGASEGAHDGGPGETEDARVALRFLAARYPHARRWLAGFSFGAWIAARLAAAESGIERLILIAPPVSTSSFEPLESLAIPKLVIQGGADDVCKPAALHEPFRRWAEPKRLVEVPGANHFFDRQLGALADAMREALAEAARGGASCTA
ncbi:MAG TPA: alpha/beta fold hydrolase [Candidatus Eisenbacteria bacterium]